MSVVFVISDEEEETPLQTAKVRGSNGYQNVYEDGDLVAKKDRMYLDIYEVEINNKQRKITEQEAERSDEDVTYVPDDIEEEQVFLNPIRCMIHDIIFGADLGPSPKEFPYEKLEKIEEHLVKSLKNISFASETTVWEFVLNELRCIRFAYDRIKDIDLKTDAKFNLILVRILGQYVNFRARKTAANKHLTSIQINGICKEVWMQIVGLVGSSFVHVMMVLLRTDVQNYPLDVLLYPLCKMIHARLLREKPDNFPKILIIIVAVLFYKNWLLMCTRSDDRKRHKELARNSLEMNFPEIIGQINCDFNRWKRVDDRIRQALQKSPQRNARQLFDRRSLDVCPAIANFYREYSEFLKQKENASLVQTMISKGNTNTTRPPVLNQTIPTQRIQRTQRGRRQQPELQPKHQLKQQNQRAITRPNSSLVNARSSRYNRNLKSKKNSINKIGTQNRSPKSDEVTVHNIDENANLSANATPLASTSSANTLQSSSLSEKPGEEITVDITEIDDSDEITNSEDVLKQSNITNINSSEEDIAMLPLEICEHENTVHTTQKDIVQCETKPIEDSESSVLVNDISLKNLPLNANTLSKNSKPETIKIICSENSNANESFCQSQSVDQSVNVVNSEIVDITESIQIERHTNLETYQVSLPNMSDIPKTDSSNEPISISGEQSAMNIDDKNDDLNTVSSIEITNKSDPISIIASDEECQTEMNTEENIDSKPTEHLNQLTEMEASNEAPKLSEIANKIDNNSEVKTLPTQAISIVDPIKPGEFFSMPMDVDKDDNITAIVTSVSSQAVEEASANKISENIEISNNLKSIETSIENETEVETSKPIADEQLSKKLSNIQVIDSDLNSNDSERFCNLVIDETSSITESPAFIEEHSAPMSLAIVKDTHVSESPSKSHTFVEENSDSQSLAIVKENSVPESQAKSAPTVDENCVPETQDKSLSVVEANFDSESQAKLLSIVEANYISELPSKSPEINLEENSDSESLAIVDENSVPESQDKSVSIVEKNFVPELPSKSPATIVEEYSVPESQTKSASVVEENAVFELQTISPAIVEEDYVSESQDKSPTTIIEDNFDSESLGIVEENSVHESQDKSASIVEKNFVPELPSKSPATIVDENSVPESQTKSASDVKENAVFELQTISPAIVEENYVSESQDKLPTTIIEENPDSESLAIVEENSIHESQDKSPTVVEENDVFGLQVKSPSIVEQNFVSELPSKSPASIAENSDSESLAIVEENSVPESQGKSASIAAEIYLSKLASKSPAVEENFVPESQAKYPVIDEENAETKNVLKMNGADILKNKSSAKLRTTRYNSLIDFPSTDEKNEQYDKFLEGLYCDPVKKRNVSKLKTYSNRRLNGKRSNIQVRRLTISTTIHKILDGALPIFETNKWKSNGASNTDLNRSKESIQLDIQNDSNLTDQIQIHDSKSGSNKCDDMVIDLPTSTSLQTNNSADIIDTTLLNSCDELENRSKITIDNSMLFDDYPIQTDSEEKIDIDIEKDATEMSIECQNEVPTVDSNDKLQTPEDNNEACSEQPEENINDDPEDTMDVDEPIKILEGAMREKNDIEINVEHIDSRSSSAEEISTTEEINNQPSIFGIDNEINKIQENVFAMSEPGTEIEQNNIDTSITLSVESTLNEKSENILSINDHNKIQNVGDKPMNADIQHEDRKIDHILEEAKDIDEDELILPQPIQEDSIQSASEKDKIAEVEPEKDETESVDTEKDEDEEVEHEKDEAEEIETENFDSERDEIVAVEPEKDETESFNTEKDEGLEVETDKDETENFDSEKVGIVAVEPEKDETESFDTEKDEAEEVETDKDETESFDSEKVEIMAVEPEKDETESFDTEKDKGEKVETEKDETENFNSEKVEIMAVEPEKDETESFDTEKDEGEKVETEKDETENFNSEKDEIVAVEPEKDETESFDTEKDEAEEVETEKDETLEKQNDNESSMQEEVSKIEEDIALNVLEVKEESNTNINNLMPLEKAQENEKTSSKDEMVFESEVVADELQTKITDQNTSSMHPTVIITSHLDRECHKKSITIERNDEFSIEEEASEANLQKQSEIDPVGSNIPIDYTLKSSAVIQLVEKIEENAQEISECMDSQSNTFSESFSKMLRIQSPGVSEAITENIHCFQVEQLQQSISASTNVSIPLFIPHISSTANRSELAEAKDEMEKNISFSSLNSQLTPLDYSKNLESDGNKNESPLSLTALVDTSINTTEETEKYDDSEKESNGYSETNVSQNPDIVPMDLSYTPNKLIDERLMIETDTYRATGSGRRTKNCILQHFADLALEHGGLTKIALKSIEPYEEPIPPLPISTLVECASEILTNVEMNKRIDSEPAYISNESQSKEIMELKNDQSRKRKYKVDKNADRMSVRKSTRINPSRHAKEVAETNIISSKRRKRSHANEIIDQEKMDFLIEKSKSTICRARDTIEEILPCITQPIESPQQIESPQEIKNSKPQYEQKPVDREALKDSFINLRKDKKLAIKRSLQEKSRNIACIEEIKSNQSIDESPNEDEFRQNKRPKHEEVPNKIKRISTKHRSPLVMKKTYECNCLNDRDQIIKSLKNYNEKIPPISDREDVIILINPSIPIEYVETRTTLINIKKIFFLRLVDLMDQKSPDVPYLKELRDKLNNLEQIGIEENILDDAFATYKLMELKCQECHVLNPLTCDVLKNFQKFLNWWSKTFKKYYNSSEQNKPCSKKNYDTEESSDSNSQEKDNLVQKNLLQIADKPETEKVSIMPPFSHNNVPEHVQRFEYHGDMLINQSSSENTNTISDCNLITPITMDPSDAMLSFTSETSQLDMDHMNHTNNNTQKAILTNTNEDSFSYNINMKGDNLDMDIDEFDLGGNRLENMFEELESTPKNPQVSAEMSNSTLRPTEAPSLATLSAGTDLVLVSFKENGESVQNVVTNVSTLSCVALDEICPPTLKGNKRNDFRRNFAQMTNTYKNVRYYHIEPDNTMAEAVDDIYTVDDDDPTTIMKSFEWKNGPPKISSKNEMGEQIINSNNNDDQLLKNSRRTINPNVSSNNSDPSEFSITQRVDNCPSIEANRMSFEEHDNYYPSDYDPNAFLAMSPKTPTCDRMHVNEADIMDPDGNLTILLNPNEQIDNAQQIASKNNDFPFKQPLNVSLSRGHSSRHSSDSKSHRSKRKNMQVAGDEEPLSHSSRSSHENGTPSSTGDQYSNNSYNQNVLQPKSQRLSKTDETESEESDSNDNISASTLNSSKYIVKNTHVKSKSNKSSKKHSKSGKSSAKNSVEVNSKVIQIKFKKMPPEEKSNRNSHKVYSTSNKVATDESSEWDDDEENNAQFWPHAHRTKTLPI